MNSGELAGVPPGAVTSAQWRSYRPSWVNLLAARIDRLPGPAWAFYVALGAGTVTASSANLWLSGLAPVGTVDLAQSYYGLRLVSWIHARAVRIDLFQPGPLYAFSRLTSRTGIGIVLLQAPTAFLIPPTQVATVTWVAWLLPINLFAVAVFVLPLQGIHRRIADEKSRLVAEVGRRMTATITDIHASVDERDRSEADALNKTLTGLIAERDLVARLPTWPWAGGTLWAFGSAIALPIGLWLVTRLLERVV